MCLDTGSGCPNRESLTSGGCVFCDSSGGGTGAWLRGESLEDQIARGMKSALGHYKAKACILYFQSYSATYGSPDRFIEAVERATVAARRFVPVVGLSVGTRPDLVHPWVVDYLTSLVRPDFQVWLELGVQTTDEKGLLWLRRGHDLKAVEDCLERCQESPFFLCAHLIAGIPGERDDQLLRSARWLLDRGVSGLKFHPLYVLKDTPLEELYRQGDFEPLSMEDYASKVAEVIDLEGSRFVVQRIAADVRGERLIAPKWIEEKNRVIAEIEGRLGRHSMEVKLPVS
nr:TIGR01212 family radical SAM protein [uncultured Dethiosulfovibrio sp.]